MDWYLKVLKNYVGFRGRARRKEYWMFILVNIIFTFVLGLLFLIPFIGWLIIIVFNCQAGTPGENRFGPDPKLEP
ncbi:TPA: DUF805 domain-containing protein [Escherichia coli]|nr:DUF805 domain-containing protein [Escherichia coli]